MHTVRWLAVAVLTLTAAVVQSAFIPGLGLRLHSAVLVYLIILAIARRLDFGPALALALGAGLLVDLTPPAAGPVGVNALIAVLAAALMFTWSRATASDAAGLMATLTLLVTAIALTTLARAWATDVFAESTPGWVLLKAVVRDCVIAFLITPIVLPLVDWLARPRSASWRITGGSGVRR